jgi:hypothetical protein
VYVACYGWAPQSFREVLQGVVLTLLIGWFAYHCGAAAPTVLTDHSRFDRYTGQAARRCFFRAVWEVDLRNVVVVQCLHGGWFRGPKGRWCEAYQVNLVLKTGEGCRHNVCSEEKREWARSRAGALADFLGVPLVDQIEETSAPKPPPRWWE